MSESTVVLIQPRRSEIKITTTMTFREAAILRILLGRTTGEALQDLYDALSAQNEIRHEAHKLESTGSNPHEKIDILSWEKAE